MLNLLPATRDLRLRADASGRRPAPSVTGPAVLHPAGARSAG
jgi:hypothetical protein